MTSVTCFLWLHNHRDTALGVKADVDGLLEAFGSAEETISDLENKVQNTTDLVNNLNDSLTKVGRMHQAVHDTVPSALQ